MQKSNIFIISGPSGAGEDSIMEGIKKHFQTERIINTTTREMREGEINGESYYFISKKEFERKISENEFIEHAQHYNGNIYGVTKSELERVKNSGKIGTWKLEYKGVMTVKKLYPEIISIFINAPTLEILESRIRRRDNVSDAYIEERMSYTKEWLKYIDIYDYVVINEENKLNKAIGEVVNIIKSNI